MKIGTKDSIKEMNGEKTGIDHTLRGECWMDYVFQWNPSDVNKRKVPKFLGGSSVVNLDRRYG